MHMAQHLRLVTGGKRGFVTVGKRTWGEVNVSDLARREGVTAQARHNDDERLKAHFAAVA